MLKRFEDYKQAVILAYKEKKKAGQLPPNLDRHTPANLKKECLDEFLQRYSDKDSNTFKTWFGRADNAEQYYQLIRNADPDIFRPLNNFLKGNTDDTKERNIHLLAWLIDFEPRPFTSGDIYDLVKSDMESSATLAEPWTEEHNDNREEIAKEVVEENGTIDQSNASENIKTEYKEGTLHAFEDTEQKIEPYYIPRKFNKTIMAFTVVLVIVIGSYIIYQMTRHQYMYWDGGQYQAIDYDQKVDGAVVVPLDTFRLAHLKKIKNIAAITRNAIGKVHYSKINGKVEFYTTGGENPEDSNRRLLPMTEYMYEKYVLNKTKPMGHH